MSSGHVSAAKVTDLLRRARLNPAQWDLSEIARKANAWITDNLNELSYMGAGWSPEEQAAHLAEFGHLTAIDFIEQCVIEAGPATAPWTDLAARADAGEFASWPPVWQAQRPAHLRSE